MVAEHEVVRAGLRAGFLVVADDQVSEAVDRARGFAGAAEDLEVHAAEAQRAARARDAREGAAEGADFALRPCGHLPDLPAATIVLPRAPAHGTVVPDACAVAAQTRQSAATASG